MATPTNFNIFKWTDPGAPNFNYVGAHATVGAQITQILDACLVTGYGSKSSLGWTKPYTSGGYHVYKMGNNSSGRYMQVYNPVATYPNTTLNNYNSLVNLYDSMTSVTEGSGSIYGQSTFPRAGGWNMGGFGGNEYGLTDHTIPWILIGNSAGFYLWKPSYTSINNAGSGGLGAYANNTLNIVGCIDILSYDLTIRTMLMLDVPSSSTRSSANNYMYCSTKLTERMLDTTLASSYGIYITNSRPFKVLSNTVTDLINLRHSKVALISDDVSITWGLHNDVKFTNKISTFNNLTKSKVFVMGANIGGMSNPVILGELPGMSRFMGHKNQQGFVEESNYLLFGGPPSTFQYGRPSVAIEKTGAWYGNPHFL